MEGNKYNWNQTLRFSWGHIIAFVALIFISYLIYMGDFYLNGGDFLAAAIKVAIIDVAILITFIGAQWVKGTDEKFRKYIIVERTLIVITPVVFVFAMFYVNHFWSVFKQKEKIESYFNSSIVGAKNIFNFYDTYSENRLRKYEERLDNILINKRDNPDEYSRCGFVGFSDDVVKQSFIHVLDLQLRSKNTENLKFAALGWIDQANDGVSVWNAFLVGNVNQISKAITSWHKSLKEFSIPLLSNEYDQGKLVLPFDDNNQYLLTAIERLDALNSIYINYSGINFTTIWLGIILYLMLLFPYYLQRRNTRAEGLFSLIPDSIFGFYWSFGDRKAELSDDSSFSLPKGVSRQDDSEKPSGKSSLKKTNDDIYDGTVRL